MDVEIITIGDELLIGQVIDTNSAWMGQCLGDEGFRVVWRTTVGDVEEDMLEAFNRAMKNNIIVENEKADYNFSSDHMTFTPYANSKAPTFEEQFKNSFEQTYVNEAITKLNSQRLIILPMIVALDGDKKLCITESDLEDFPGMFLNNSTDKPSLKAIHAPYPKVEEQGGHNMLQMLVKERESYIAKTKGTRAFPCCVCGNISTG